MKPAEIAQVINYLARLHLEARGSLVEDVVPPMEGELFCLLVSNLEHKVTITTHTSTTTPPPPPLPLRALWDIRLQ